ncbi:hypothetical protein WH47_05116 [Habropoda laboriosa]|uniref:Uncharacterized protein n=1 Tax=Habropoda laboriosa TaxID=597456 RepID=A0A0L7QS95_9HYME|nr:hypothetical protein WH47_05116 [Habropoda laboriosa]
MRSIPVFDFVLTCRHYGICFGQPPVEKAPSWSWISITVVMATAIDSTGVRPVEENGENDRARPRDAAQGLNSTGQFYGVGLEIRRSFEARLVHPFPPALSPFPSSLLLTRLTHRHRDSRLTSDHRHRRVVTSELSACHPSAAHQSLSTYSFSFSL